MKVLMLGWELPPHNSGGLGVACYQLCQAMAHKGIDIEFVLPYTAQHDITFMNVNHASERIAHNSDGSAGAYASYRYLSVDESQVYDLFQQEIEYQNKVETLADKVEFDIIHAHDWLTFRAALRAKQKSGKPLIVHVHSIESDRAGGNRGNPLVRSIEELTFSLADQIVAVSEHTKSAIVREYGVPANDIDVIHNAIDAQSLTAVEDASLYQYLKLMKSCGYKIVVNVGRLTIQKNLPNLLRAAALVIKKEPQTIFLIVGNGEQREELIELSAQLGISRNVIFTGFLRGQAWRESFVIGDLFVMPSVSEPFGLTPLEAVAYGTPALISKQSGVSEVLHNVLKVDYWDIDAMANQITAVIRSSGLRTHLAANAVVESHSITWHEPADRFIKMYARHQKAILV